MTTATLTPAEWANHIAQALLESGIPLYRLLPGRKAPYTAPSGERAPWGNVDVIDDPDQLAGWLKPGDNLGCALGWSKESPLIGVGLDTYKDRTITDFAKTLGVTSSDDVWVQRTGRGGWTIYYAYDGPELKRQTTEKGSAIDLLTNGYGVVAPSNSAGEPEGGGPYRWHPGKSPLDIPFGELATPPKDLLTWWQSLNAPKLPDPQRGPGRTPLPDWLTAPIPTGQRNTTLTQIAGWYHRQLSEDSLVRHLVHQANTSQCLAPLSGKDVDSILDSILKKDGAGHFRGITPGTLAKEIK